MVDEQWAIKSYLDIKCIFTVLNVQKKKKKSSLKIDVITHGMLLLFKTQEQRLLSLQYNLVFFGKILYNNE